jgi:hypothetical protein
MNRFLEIVAVPQLNAPVRQARGVPVLDPRLVPRNPSHK